MKGKDGGQVFRRLEVDEEEEGEKVGQREGGRKRRKNDKRKKEMNLTSSVHLRE